MVCVCVYACMHVFIQHLFAGSNAQSFQIWFSFHSGLQFSGDCFPHFGIIQKRIQAISFVFWILRRTDYVIASPFSVYLFWSSRLNAKDKWMNKRIQNDRREKCRDWQRIYAHFCSSNEDDDEEWFNATRHNEC